jgi:hypothetical protein
MALLSGLSGALVPILTISSLSLIFHLALLSHLSSVSFKSYSALVALARLGSSMIQITLNWFCEQVSFHFQMSWNCYQIHLVSLMKELEGNPLNLPVVQAATRHFRCLRPNFLAIRHIDLRLIQKLSPRTLVPNQLACNYSLIRHFLSSWS